MIDIYEEYGFVRRFGTYCVTEYRCSNCGSFELKDAGTYFIPDQNGPISLECNSCVKTLDACDCVTRSLSGKGMFEAAMIAEEWEIEAGDKPETKLTKGARSIRFGNEAHLEVFERGGNFWRAARSWGIKNQKLSPEEARTLDICASIPERIPTERLCVLAMCALNKLEAGGYMPDKVTVSE